ncbi:MAG: hypothetical protein ACOVQG_05775 [Crocinitomicaceae bacterium]|jgi:hypothetical protein
MKKVFSSFIVTIFLSNLSLSQISINAGTGILKGFTTDKSFFGLNAGIEMPRSNDVTFYGRIGHYFPRLEEQVNSTFVTASDFTTIPYQLSVNYQSKMNYTTFEGGTRYYLGNDYDNGFSLYGGGNFMLYINSVKRDYDKEDATGNYTWEENYQLPTNEPEKGKILSIAMGLQGGMKYTIPATGTFYFDVNGQYSIFGQASNNNISTELYSPLFFTINIGFRKDLY